MRNRRRWLGMAAVGLGFGGFGAWVASRQYKLATADHSAVDLLLGMSMPDAQGNMTTMADFRGRPLVVNFWATWCPPCIGEMPELDQIQREYAGRGLQILGIGVDTATNIREFADKTPYSYPLLVAGAGGSELSRRFGNQVAALPFTALVDRQGRIRRKILGRFVNAELRAAIDDIL